MIQYEFEKKLLLFFAYGSSNKSLQNYLHSLEHHPYDISLSRNMYIDNQLFLEIFPTLRKHDRIVALNRPLDKDMALHIAKDPDLMVRQAIFEVAYKKYMINDVTFQALISQDWVDGAIADLIMTSFPVHLNNWDLKQLARFGFATAQEEKTAKRACASRSTKIKNAMDAESSRPYAQLWSTLKIQDALNTKVYNTIHSTSVANLSLVNTISAVIGQKPPAYWNLFFSMASAWSDTYQTLLQTLDSLAEQEQYTPALH